jgi:hypothetical protein
MLNTNQPNYIAIFNNHFNEFIEDFILLFPNDVDLLSAKNSMLLVRKANPKLLIKIWKKYVVDPYKHQIDAGNFDFFIEKDYSQDLVKNDNANKIIKAIDNFREPIKTMSIENKTKTMKYIENLSKISLLYQE